MGLLEIQESGVFVQVLVEVSPQFRDSLLDCLDLLSSLFWQVKSVPLAISDGLFQISESKNDRFEIDLKITFEALDLIPWLLQSG